MGRSEHFDLRLNLIAFADMTDTISQVRRSENMRRIRSKDMKPELLVRRILTKLGYRYRLHRRSLPGHPDIVFPRWRKAIFVHGCFWHQHRKPSCRIKRIPRSNLDYWLPKLRRNVSRDSKNQRALKELDWDLLVIWECELANLDLVIGRLERFMAR